MRWLKKIFIGIVIFLSLLILSLFVLTSFYEDKVKKLLIKELQKNVTCEIFIADLENDVQLSLIDNFPKASLGFKGIWSHGNDVLKQDTLFYLQELDILFDLSNIFENEFTVNEIHLGKGFVHVNIDERNQANYMVWKTDTSSVSEVNVSIEDIKFSDVKFRYKDKKANHKVQVRFDDFQSTLGINDSSTHIVSSGLLGNLDLRHYSNQIKPLNTYVDLDVNILGTNVEFSKLLLETTHANIDVTGNWSDKSGAISYKVEKINYSDIDKFVVLEPSDLEALKPLKGSFSASGSVENVSGRIRLKTDLKSSNSTYQYESTKLEKIKYDLGLKISDVNNTNNAKLEIRDIQFLFNQVPVELKGSLSNWSWLAIEGHSKGNLASFTEYIDSSFYEELSGEYDANFTYKTSLKYVDQEVISKLAVSGSLSNLKTHVKDTPYFLKDFSGGFDLSKGQLNIKGFKGFINQSDVEITGAVSHLFDDQKTSLDANIKSKHILLEDLLDTEGESGEVYIPENIQFKITTDFEKMTYGKFDASKVSGSLSYGSKQLYFFPLTMNSCDGKLVLRGKLDARNANKIEFKGNTDLRSMDLQKLFYQMNNFTQDYVTDKHTRGIVDAEIETYLPFDRTLDPLIKDVFVLGKIKISDGELIDNEMMMELSDFIRVSELKHIKFSELENQIKIENQRIYIPEMDIQSSAMNITLQGEQGFDETIDYHFVVSLSEVLAKRAKKDKKDNEDFGEEIEGGTGIRLFLQMTGTLDDPKLSYDRRNMITKLKEDIKGEKKVFKDAIIKEIQSFKKEKEEEKENEKSNKQDEKPKEEPEESPQIEVEWDDDDW